MVTQISTHSHSYRGFVIVTLPVNVTRPLTQYQITLRNGADECHSFGNENSLQEAIKFIDNLFINKE